MVQETQHFLAARARELSHESVQPLPIVSSTNAQMQKSTKEVDDVPSDLLPKVKGLERTDLFSGVQQRANDT